MAPKQAVSKYHFSIGKHVKPIPMLLSLIRPSASVENLASYSDAKQSKAKLSIGQSMVI